MGLPWLAKQLGKASGLLSNAEPPPPPTKHVLVPPMFERDIRDRDRFAYSSYEYLSAKRPLKWLFEDYITDGPWAKLLFAPPAENRFTVETAVGPGQANIMVLRFQPLGVHQPSTFMELAASPNRPGDATFRASAFDPKSGLGAFVTAPMAKRISGAAAQVGIRYSSPMWTAGFIAEPRTGQLSSSWLAARTGDVVYGFRVNPRGGPSFDSLLRSASSALSSSPSSSSSAAAEPPGSQQPSGTQPAAAGMEWARQHVSAIIAYEPRFTSSNGGQGQFSASVEMLEGKNLLVSFYQHMAIMRQIVNPTEDKNVIGITNYIDLGIQISIPTDDAASTPTAAAAGSTTASTSSAGTKVPTTTTTPPVPVAKSNTGREDDSSGAGSINLAAAWQVNKNWLLKARISSESASAALAVKTWGRLGLVGAGSVTYRYGDPNVRWGMLLQLENFGERRYERGVSELSGRAVLQRHEASLVDVANAEGTTGRVVQLQAAEQEYNKPRTDATAAFM